MSLSLAELTSLISPIIGGMEASHLTPTQVVNMAGRWFCAAHDWRVL